MKNKWKHFLALDEEVTSEVGDKYVQASIMIPCSINFAWGTVVSHKRNTEGNIIQHAHVNLILDNCLYDIEVADGTVTALPTNTMARSMYAQCDPDRNKYILLDEFVDVKHTENDLTLNQQTITICNSTCQRKSTKGWFICCRWKDGSTTWEKQTVLKKSHPVQVNEFAIHMGIALESSLNQWVFPVLKK